MRQFTAAQAIAKSSYAETLTAYREVFGEDQFLCCFYDQLREDPAGFLAQITAWREVSELPAERIPPPLAAASYPEMPPHIVKALAQRLSDSTRALCAIYPNIYTHGWKERIENARSLV